MPKKLKVLVVDDTEVNLLLISKFLNRLGHEAVLARNGIEAVEQFKAGTYDLILMDVMMPEMDGYEATAKIREIGTHWVPIIFLTAKTQDADHIKGIQVGGDDYISKPINLLILEARIKAVTRIAEMQQQILENTQQLESYRDDNERELQLAKHLIEKITHSIHEEHEHVRSWTMPALNFSGDIFISARTPADEIYLLLADGTGHGLAAALNVIPVVDVFFSMATKGFSISSIANELNNKIKMLMPTERFVAATLVSINFNDRALRIWNGGNPKAIFANKKGEILHRWESTHPALGIFNDHEFDSSSEVFQWPEPGQLFLCSDGLIEAQNPDGEEFGFGRLENSILNTTFDQRHDVLMEAISHHIGGFSAHDDVSLVTIDCPVNLAENIQPQKPDAHTPPSLIDKNACRWKVELLLTAAELRVIDVVPMLLTWMDNLQLNQNHRGQVFLIVSELLNNALDHGILKLDSALKNHLEGFEHYIEQRSQRLNNLQHGIIEITLERLCHHDNEILGIRIKDSGDGFDYNAVFGKYNSSGTRISGRGLTLIKNLCSKIEFTGNGSEVSVYYNLA